MTKSKVSPEIQQQFLFKPYRYFSQPKQVGKGKHYVVCFLWKQGMSPTEIKQLLNMNKVETLIEFIEEGKKKSPSEFLSKKMDEADVCRCFGSFYQNKIL